MSIDDPADGEPSPVETFLWWTGLWLVFVSPDQTPDNAPRRGLESAGRFWLLGLIVLVMSWAWVGVTLRGVVGQPDDAALVQLAPVAAFVGLWVVGTLQFWMRGATRQQRGVYFDTAFLWMGFPGPLVQLALFVVAVGIAWLAAAER